MKPIIGRDSNATEVGCGSLEDTRGEDGVDLSLIQWMLSLTPDERWDVLDQFASDMLELRDGETSV